MTCADCGRALTRDEEGLSRKLISRAAEHCYCMDCLSRRYRVDRQSLEDLIERYRQSGCTLFV